eukprot:SAG11_NODE_1307_length_5243_cov_2.389774_1_plen_112_part_00
MIIRRTSSFEIPGPLNITHAASDLEIVFEVATSLVEQLNAMHASFGLLPALLLVSGADVTGSAPGSDTTVPDVSQLAPYFDQVITFLEAENMTSGINGRCLNSYNGLCHSA